MSLTKPLYETTFIVNASLEDPQVETVLAHVSEVITRNGGEIKAVNKWGRKRLAYTIQKKNNGFYINIEFEAPGSVVQQLEHNYILDENILRFLTIQVSKKAIKAREQSISTLPPEEVAPAPIAVPEKAPIFADDVQEPPK
jgi:small subunit ribosomal protein S6